MKKLLFVALLFVAGCSYGQTWDPIKGRFEYQSVRIDSNLRVPNDTLRLTASDTGSLAKKNGCLFSFQRVAGIYKWDLIACGHSVAPLDTFHILATGEIVDSVYNLAASAMCEVHQIFYDKFTMPVLIGKRINVYIAGLQIPDKSNPANCEYFDFDITTGTIKIYPGQQYPGLGFNIKEY